MLSIIKRKTLFKRKCRNFSSKTALICGGNGALGQAIISTFQRRGWKTVNVDFNANKNADTNLLVDFNIHWKENTKNLEKEISSKQMTFESMICVAGGWAGERINDDAIFENFEKQVNVNLKSSICTAYLATKSIKPNGLLVMTGSAPIYEGGSGSMISYGISKAGVHNLVLSLADDNSGMPEGVCTVGILPTTKKMREGMTNADFDSWTDPYLISKCVVKWSEDMANLPESSASKDMNVDLKDTSKQNVGKKKAVPRAESGKFYTFETHAEGSMIQDFINGEKVKMDDIYTDDESN